MNKSSNVNNFHLNGYEMFHVDRLSRKGGGVAVYINNKFNCKLLNDQYLSIENVCECVTVEICLKKSKNIIISCIYRTPDSQIDNFNQNIENINLY